MADTTIAAQVAELGRRARAAATVVGASPTAARNRALACVAEEVAGARAEILAANGQDLDAAAALDDAMRDRLRLDDGLVDAMLDGLAQVAALPDPVGAIGELNPRPSGIRVGRMRVPLGVVGMVYEARPNVTIDAAALCLKAGNAVILRGGSEALRSNTALADCVARGLERAGLPPDCAQLVRTADRAAVGALLGMSDCVDVIVPRGGRSLIERVAHDARVPVIKHLDGVCHVFIDAAAEVETGVAIAVNAKTQRFGVCNAMETLLIDAPLADRVLPEIRRRMAGVELRVCERAARVLPDAPRATEADWSTEYLGPILSVRVVEGLDEALRHIARYGSGHTDAIVTTDYARAMRFMREVDSSSVMVNASTRFADGYEYGLGAEIGISTDRLHVRGPVGLEGLTTLKYVVFGDGQVRA